MKKHLEENWLIYLLAVPFVVFSVIFPDAKITLTGGFAWSLAFLSWLFGVVLVWTGIVGGELSIKSKGLVGWIKEFKKSSY
ncbi:hypothetical protein G9G63_09435 [Paenibacillus sp. EKM202P]|uniref:hypothetical protein n=1 Tax=unclassified Paenibacillus TaxID=185978 RepID=UPI0013EC58A6|nr:MULTISPECIES: hypothetical protein [unclassified Paenibacillus]KAF6565371.1 hypothetical protein G9G63_09435 [Paenibacillus sp. EKM202P]KAF6569304.1 hypothetical protein G9G64_12660 [Paenibacillus sp. EKM207P]